MNLIFSVYSLMSSIEFENEIFISFFSVCIIIFLDLFQCYYLDISQTVPCMVKVGTCGIVDKIIHIATMVSEAIPQSSLCFFDVCLLALFLSTYYCI